MVMAAGGSGGHLFPAVAVADEFVSRMPDSEVTFIGSEGGLESKVIPKEGYSIKFIKAEGYLGRSPLGKASSALKMLGSLLASRSILKAAGPDVVVGSGGYVSVGPVLAARSLGIPTVIMEQNMVPGMANKFLARFAGAVAVTYHESMSFFPRDKTYLTGNPIRPAIMSGSRADGLGLFSLHEDRVTVLVLGGSSGARNINNLMLGALNNMLDVREQVQFLHQTGEQDYEGVRRAYRKLDYAAMVSPFIYQMAESYAAADLVVSRAGATTLAELTALGKPSILIPYKYAGGHQEFNAIKLQETGACRLLNEQALSGEELAASIKELVVSEDARAEMSKQSRALGRPEAASKVVDIAVSLGKAGKGNV